MEEHTQEGPCAEETRDVVDDKSSTAASVRQPLREIKSLFQHAISALSKQSPDANVADDVMQCYEQCNKILAPLPKQRLPWAAICNLIDTAGAEIGFGLDWKRRSEQCAAQLPASRAIQALQSTYSALEQWAPEKTFYQLRNDDSKTTEISKVEEADAEEQLRASWPIAYPQGDILLHIPPNLPRRPYQQRDRKGRWRHWGQRKLMLNEIEFLSLYAHENDTVVYAGAAPAHHTSYLADMFPTLYFVLVDPAPFGIEATERIRIVNGLFTDDMASEYVGRQDILFISDIRRTFASEELIEEDMRDQMRWHDIMQPRASHFKFRLPWDAGKTEYLDGIVYIQPYAQPQSTETRLVATSSARRVWCHKEYEEQCYFFNTIVRKAWHDHDVHGTGFEQGSYDCAAEAEILRTYFSRRFGEEYTSLSRVEQNDIIAILAIRITASIGGGQAREWLSRSNRQLLRCICPFVPSLLSAAHSSRDNSDSSKRRASRTDERGSASDRADLYKNKRGCREHYASEEDARHSGKRTRHDHEMPPRVDRALPSERYRDNRHRR